MNLNVNSAFKGSSQGLSQNQKEISANQEAPVNHSVLQSIPQSVPQNADNLSGLGKVVNLAKGLGNGILGAFKYVAGWQAPAAPPPLPSNIQSMNIQPMVISSEEELEEDIELDKDLDLEEAEESQDAHELPSNSANSKNQAAANHAAGANLPSSQANHAIPPPIHAIPIDQSTDDEDDGLEDDEFYDFHDAEGLENQVSKQVPKSEPKLDNHDLNHVSLKKIPALTIPAFSKSHLDVPLIESLEPEKENISEKESNPIDSTLNAKDLSTYSSLKEDFDSKPSLTDNIFSMAKNAMNYTKKFIFPFQEEKDKKNLILPKGAEIMQTPLIANMVQIPNASAMGQSAPLQPPVQNLAPAPLLPILPQSQPVSAPVNLSAPAQAAPVLPPGPVLPANAPVQPQIVSAQASAPASALPAANGAAPAPADPAAVIPAPAPAPAPAPVPQAPLDPIVELKRVKSRAASAPTTKDASQEILSDILATYNNFPKIYQTQPPATLTSSLAKDASGKYLIEPYKGTDETVYYRIKVTYSVVAKHIDPTQPDEVIQFTRTISTNSTNPEDAILISINFKNHMCELSKKIANMGSSLDSADQDFLTHSKTSRIFSFNFSKNAAGRLSQLQSIQVESTTDKTKKFQFNIPAPAPGTSKKYLYDMKSKKYAEAKAEDLKKGCPLGSIVYDTEDEIILHKKDYQIQQDEHYDNLLQQKDLVDAYIAKKKSEIESMKSEFNKLKENFIETTFFQWLSKDIKLKKEYEKVKDEAVICQQINSQKKFTAKEIEKLPPKMQQFIQVQSDLQKMTSDRDIVEQHLMQIKSLKPQQPVNNASADDSAKIDAAQKEILKLYKASLSNPNVALPAVNEAIDDALLDEFINVIDSKKGMLSKQVELKEKLLNTIQGSITKEQESFNKHLEKLTQFNDDIKMHAMHLEGLRTRAKQKLTGSVAVPLFDKQLAQKVQKNLSFLDNLMKEIQKNDKAIDKIMDKLEVVGAHGGSSQSTVVVG